MINQSRHTRYFLSSLYFFLLLFLTGCVGNHLPFYYYTLESSKQTERGTDKSIPDIMVGPVKIASFLTKGQLVKQHSPYTISIEEQHRWAGDLHEMFSNALIENLAVALGSGSIYSYLDNREPGAVQVDIALLHFEKDFNGQAFLQARWKIIDTNQVLLYSKTSSFSRQPQNSEYSALVQALSINLSNLSKEIADTIRTTTFPKNRR